MASLAWTDGISAATLTNGKTGGGERFTSWCPTHDDSGPGAAELGSRQRHFFSLGESYGATFALEHIPATSMSLMTRLRRHLLFGGTVTVDPDDGTNGPYDCCLAPNADVPRPEMMDRELVEYRMTFDVIRNDNVQAALECWY